MLADGPVVDGIPFLRAGREALARQVQDALDRGDPGAARVLLLADADDWWDQAPPPAEQLAEAARASTLREAVLLLGMGRVGDYFLHRWSDPTFLSGLALLQQHWPGERPVVEVACGAGHFLRELHARGVQDLLGVDVVWAKLWLAQRFVCPEARYVCADLTQPLAPASTSTYVLCHDALYFLRDKPAAVAGLRALAGPDGTVVVGHAHVCDPGGLPLPAGGWARLLEADVLYDDDELTRALVEGRSPRPAQAAELERSEAVGLVRGPGGPAPVDLGQPVGALVPNPLYAGGELRWPSERYAEEYGPRSSYLPPRWPDPLPPDAARRRLLLDLPEQW